ncbi:MAG: cobaltochelatase subunit CobT [Gammaproteobacteria bacterium]
MTFSRVAKTEVKDRDRRQRFEWVTRAATRALAQRKDLSVEFRHARATIENNTVYLHAPSVQVTPSDVIRLRGEADSLALQVRYHDRALHEALAPGESSAREVFDSLEQARCEALGARRMVGVAANLEAWLAARYRDAAEREPLKPNALRLPDSVQLMAREAMTGSPPPAPAARLLDTQRRELTPKIGGALVRLSRNLSDQRRFAEIVMEILVALGLDVTAASDSVEREAPDEPEQGGEESDPQSAESMASEAQGGPPKALEDQHRLDSTTAHGMSSHQEPDGISSPGAAEQRWMPKDTPAGVWRSENCSASSSYRAYMTDFDEVVHAQQLCTQEELARFRSHLDRQVRDFDAMIGRLANRLQRRLLAKQLRGWQFDREDGFLDTTRLARLVANPLNPVAYRWEQETAFQDTVVSLLIDNSGSMRGRPITVAAISADVLARTLERCGVKTEILGFTTRAWKGGQVRERWIEGGKPANPGRLNDLRHIIYKSADMPWRQARSNLGLMLREGLLKENIDGEALTWAYQRLLRRPEERRILMVISDGTPVDDSTLSANGAGYLERHLREVIAHIENTRSVELLAIGIGHDVTRYYRRAVMLADAEQLGGVMLQELAGLFDSELTHPRHRWRHPLR